jgi:secreted Zn-dependent insulinase-like peptidase|uniref:Peptidase M16 N-terminal domain-containing protein n=1 Tax=viral metagenome TaxID=1070528 RepID=A0A6C0IXM0_9ZZZZ
MEIIVPKNESRLFTGNTLNNGIKFINVNDKELDKSHVMVSVNIGSISDPVEFQGLSHFLEHMLFLGSKKYPGENQFETFLNENGGYSNAYTSTFETVYFFTIFNDKLEEAIDMFSRFFIDPLFDEGSVNREINAIQSEHDKNIQQDNWRMQHFYGLISKKDSMLNKFGTGDLSSLQKDGLRKRMIAYYKQYYVSSNINVVTVSKIANSTVKKYIEKSFSNIPTKIEPKIKINKPFFELQGKDYFLKSVSKDHSMIYLWEIPDHSNYLKTHSNYIISHVISSDVEGSLKSFLIKKGLVKNVYSYIMDEGLFILNVRLSKLDNWREVDSYVRYFMNDLKNNNWSKISEYYQKKDKLLFDYSSKDESNDLGLKLVTNLINYPVERTLIGTDVIEKIDVKQIKSLFTDYLTFDKANVILSSDTDVKNLGAFVKHESEQTEPYYNLKYNSIKIDTSPEKQFDYKITSDNPFLSTTPKLIKNLDENLEPTKHTVGSNKVWFGNISKFKETTISSELIFTNSEFVFELSTYINTLLLLKYINKKISEDFSLASEIGFDTHMSINTTSSIVAIYISGHNDNYNKYFNLINEYIKNFDYKDEDLVMLQMLIDSTKDNYLNIMKSNPWNYSSYIEDLDTNKKAYKINDVLRYLESLDIHSFTKKISETKNRILYQSKFTTFIYGNTLFSDLFDSKENLNILFPSIEKPRNTIKLLGNIDVVHPNKDEKDNYVQYTHYIGKFNPKDNLLLLILSIALGQDFYDELRTKQQFGYLVSSSQSKHQEDYYFKQKIQSSKSISDIDKAILLFNTQFLDNLSEKQFIKYVASAKNMLEERETTSFDLFRKYLVEISDNTYTFDRKQLLLNKLKDISFDKFKKYYVDKILNGETTKVYIRKPN